MSKYEKYIVTISVLHMDEYYTANNWPEEGGKTIIAPEVNLPGGSVSNTSCVCSTLGANVYFYDVLSKSELNKTLLQDLKNHGINVDYVNFVDGLTDSKCLIISTPAERTILGVLYPKPTVPLSQSQIELFNNASIVYTSMGAQYIIPDEYKNFMDFKHHGALLAFDVEYGFNKPNEKILLESADILFFNEFGFDSNIKDLSEEEYLDHLLESGVRIIVITLGKDGCRVKTKEDDFSIPAYDVKVVDTNGAGDTFNGSFLYGLLQGWEIYDIARFATAAAGYCVTQMGPRGGAVNEDIVRSFIKEHKSG